MGGIGGWRLMEKKESEGILRYRRVMNVEEGSKMKNDVIIINIEYISQ